MKKNDYSTMSSLTFNTSRIKIVQFTDLHLGEADDRDELSLSLMRSVLSAERPDFVVFSGDLVSGYAILSEERRRFLWQRVLGHGNEWCCDSRGMQLCYGRHSGFGGYSINSKQHGARVIDLHVDGLVSTRVV